MSGVVRSLCEKIIFRRQQKWLKMATSFFSTQASKKTSLYDFHVEHGGKMVPFAGYLMPLQYADHSILSSHLHTRKHVSLFDVSHMLQTRIHGAKKIKFMESITVSDLKTLPNGTGSLTVLLNDTGKIIDDLIVTKTSENYLYVVSNAGCREKDLAHFQNRMNDFEGVELEICDDCSLIAIQGPGSAKVIQELIPEDMNKLKFMQSAVVKVTGVECRVTRCGYTGEDGFEISIPNSKIVEITSKLLNSKSDHVLLAGLGSRDSLRLEAGLCLYGNDIDDTVTPVEGSLSWLISKRRRDLGDFPGAKIILQQLAEKPLKRRVGFVSQGPPARGQTKIFNKNDEEIGQVTSGCPSPCLNKNIAMGYVKTDEAKVGNQVYFDIRNKKIEGIISKMPFVPHKYQNK